MKEVDWLNDTKPLLHKVRVAIQEIPAPNKTDQDIILGCCWVIGMVRVRIDTVIEMLEKKERREMLELVRIKLARIIEELGITLDTIQPPGNESDYIERGIKDLEQAVGYIERGE